MNNALSLPASGVTLNLFGVSNTGTYALLHYNTLGGTSATSGAFIAGSVPLQIASDSFDFITVGNVLDLVITTPSGPTNATWNSTSGGSWSVGTNWSGGMPGNPQDTAVLGAVLTAATTAAVTLDSNRSLASLGFNDTAASYRSRVNGSRVDPGQHDGRPRRRSATAAAPLIDAPIVLGSNLNVTASTGSELTIAGSLTETNSDTSLSVSGGGELILSGTSSYTRRDERRRRHAGDDCRHAMPSSGLVTIGSGGRLVLGGGSGIGALLGVLVAD